MAPRWFVKTTAVLLREDAVLAKKRPQAGRQQPLKPVGRIACPPFSYETAQDP